jgi:UDP-N-acetylmuramate dehydrogenase
MNPFFENRLLSEVSTLGIGGPARFFVEVKAIEDVAPVLDFCKKKSLRYFVLGKGSNCLFSSRGLDAVVIHNKIDFYEEDKSGGVYVGAGYSFSHLGVRTAKGGWSGLEFAAGIPASVGGAVFMNAGAQGFFTWQALSFVDFVDDTGTLKRFSKEDSAFGYRFSCFQKMKGVIVAAGFCLTACCEARKKQLALLDSRIKTQPYSAKSAGCIFKNCSLGPAGKLIDESGLKGIFVGGAKVSTVHANFLINENNASSDDFQDLIALVQQEVLRKKGILLEPEVYWIHDGAAF